MSIEAHSCNSIRSTLSGERFPQDFVSAVKAFNDHVEFLESLSPRVKHLLPVRAINYLEVAFGGPEYFNRFDGAGGQTRDPGVIAEAVTETTQASHHIDADIADMDESTSSFPAESHSQSLPIHKHRLEYDDDSLQWLKDNFFVLPDEADVPENGRFGLAAGQSFSTLMDHFRYP
ncbi:hypothetical protein CAUPRSCDRAFT_12265 [Caulochytrium protostelioides]|uniref:Uncharacterized protein n=1 Tax=Caulochytrium protostelioides TaxID=1555241 RepID=A0A4P9WTM1_9FUNG|nr:hypothetical protein CAUPRSCDRAFT_12265 [Caulochytrium protostelioides]